ncbi:unnamed protein product [Menidia menidia]|uniref:(Atlantic silverside) hypothetical protein n=1 Tax=Menidia menidia TaxID=238744 RepID=A0A8S4BML7_9TELE|nr:unnamed protein product [Menidia menidia]
MACGMVVSPRVSIQDEVSVQESLKFPFRMKLKESFVRAKNWVKELQRQASPNIVIALAGNKADLANKRALDFQDAQSYADDNSLLFMETSAKTSMNVNEIFMAIGKQTDLEVQSSLVCEVGLVPRQRYYDVWAGLSLKLFNPVLRPDK